MLEKAAIYLDSNSAAPLKPSVCVALGASLSRFGEAVLLPNASSTHSHGRTAKRWIAESKQKIAQSLFSHRELRRTPVDLSQFHFTSSGSEANQVVIRSVFEPLFQQGLKPHWITTPVEHDSNRQMFAWMEKRGGKVDFLPIQPDGRPQVSVLPELIRGKSDVSPTALVSVIWVNNETGVITDLREVTQVCQTQGVPLHLDAAQAWGKLPIDLETLGADWVTFSGHKIGALSGVGLLWTPHVKKIVPTVLGKQDLGRRGGTENLLGIISLGAAAEESMDPLGWKARVEPCRDRLEAEILRRIPGVIVNGGGLSPEFRVANTLNLSFEGLKGDGLVMALDLEGYSVSSGSACSSGIPEPSAVLLAMGRTRAQAQSALRISLVDELPWNSLEGFVDALEKVVLRLRKGHSKRPQAFQGLHQELHQVPPAPRGEMARISSLNMRKSEASPSV